jgi:hypothetical protein
MRKQISAVLLAVAALLLIPGLGFSQELKQIAEQLLRESDELREISVELRDRMGKQSKGSDQNFLMEIAATNISEAGIRLSYEGELLIFCLLIKEEHKPKWYSIRRNLISGCKASIKRNIEELGKARVALSDKVASQLVDSARQIITASLELLDRSEKELGKK